MRFDGQKYLSEAKAEATIPEWSQAGGVVVVAVLAVVLLWSFARSMFDDGPARSNPVPVAVTGVTAGPSTTSDSEPSSVDAGRPVEPGDVAWLAVEAYALGRPQQGLMFADGSAVPARVEGGFPDGSIVSWGPEDAGGLVWVAVIDVDGPGPGVETVSVRVELESRGDSLDGFDLVGVSG